MRRRITFVQRPDSPFDLDQAVLSRASLSVRQVVAAREERVTVGLEEVNEEVSVPAHRMGSIPVLFLPCGC